VRDPAEPPWLGAGLAAILVAALAVFARANLPYGGFWYDEAVQFWISRGVDPFAAPGTPGGGVLAVMVENARWNLDPGGFTMLLSAWMGGGVDPAWLRLLPLGLLLVGLAAMARLAWVWHPSPAFGVLGAALPLASPLLLQHATEVRAYALEFAGVAVGCLFVQRARADAGPARLALTGLALAAFMSSRYSYSIFVAAACWALAPAVWLLGPGEDRRARCRRLLALGGPVLAGAACVALSLLTHRGRMTHQGGALIQYLAPATAAGKSAGDLVRAVTANLLAPVTIPVTLGAVVALLPAGWRRHAPAGLAAIGASPESRTVYRLAAGALLLSAALWRWHPWDVGRKWSLFLHALSAVLALRILADMLAWLLPAPGPPGPAAPWARAGWRAVAALAVAGLGLHAAAARRVHPGDLSGALRYLERVPLEPGSVAVELQATPVVRYLCEHGPFAGRLPYPAAFRLAQVGGPTPLIHPETRYLIPYGGPETVARAHPGIRLRAGPSWPRNLYAVDPAGP
jgi:hypothetical protein